MTDLPIFRVHFVGGDYADIAAETPKAARKKAEERHPGLLIAKVKLLKQEESDEVRKRDRAPGPMPRPVRSEAPATRSARAREERDSVRTW